MDYRENFRVHSDHRLMLSAVDPNFHGHHSNAQSAEPEAERYRQKLTHLQTVLYAEHKRSVLILLQALDAGGKDGTIRHAFTALNPQGVSVTAFKVPTQIELDHDFLWRVHPHTPGKGEIAIFNRSHYEDVLVTRVHRQIDERTWTDRYKLICAFERMLVDSGTILLKFFLHISPQEQLARFAQRLNDPTRNWKISESDYAERQLWDAYMEAYEEALMQTTTHDAPWYVIPANHKWFRNLAVSQIVADTVEELNPQYPEPSVDLAKIRRKYHLAEQAQPH